MERCGARVNGQRRRFVHRRAKDGSRHGRVDGQVGLLTREQQRARRTYNDTVRGVRRYTRRRGHRNVRVITVRRRRAHCGAQDLVRWDGHVQGVFPSVRGGECSGRHPGSMRAPSRHYFVGLCLFTTSDTAEFRLFRRVVTLVVGRSRYERVGRLSFPSYLRAGFQVLCALSTLSVILHGSYNESSS